MEKNKEKITREEVESELLDAQHSKSWLIQNNINYWNPPIIEVYEKRIRQLAKNYEIPREYQKYLEE